MTTCLVLINSGQRPIRNYAYRFSRVLYSRGRRRLFVLSHGSISCHQRPITDRHFHVSRLTSLTFLFLIIITDLNCRLACPNAFSPTQTIFVCLFLSYKNYYYYCKVYLLIIIGAVKHGRENSVDSVLNFQYSKQR